MITKLGIQYRVGIETGGIDDPFFNDIAGTAAAYCVSGNAICIVNSGKTGPVYIIQPLPVKLAGIDVILHQVIQNLSLNRIWCAGPYRCIARQVAVIIRPWIGSIVPVECCYTSVAKRITKGCCKRCIIIDPEIMCQDSNRLVRFTYTGISLFTILVTPIWVVVVGAGQVKHFLHGSTLSAILRWCTKSC